MQKFITLVFTIILTLVFTGCATLTGRERQPVTIESNPPGAKVTINGTVRGKTPLMVSLPRTRDDQLVTIEKAGYETVTQQIPKKISGMFFGNILIGGLIGMAVDLTSGKAMKYEKQMMVMLNPLDQPESQAALAKSEQTPRRKISVTRSEGPGLKVVVRGDRLFVTEVLPGSAAAKADIRKGDEIVRLDGLTPPDAALMAAMINHPMARTAEFSWTAKDEPVMTAQLDW